MNSTSRVDSARLRNAAKADVPNSDALAAVADELANTEYRLARALGNVKRSVTDIEHDLARGREIHEGFGGGELRDLLTAIGERNALLQVAKRLGVDVSKL